MIDSRLAYTRILQFRIIPSSKFLSLLVLYLREARVLVCFVLVPFLLRAILLGLLAEMAKHVGFRRTTRSTSAAYVPPQAQNPEAPKQAASSNAATSPLSSAVASKISKQETQKVFVCVRVRGGNNGSEDQAFVLDTGRNTIQRTNGSSQNFSCDSVVPPKASTEDLYKKHIRPIVITVLDGYNATVIAFGQTGSGKTYSTRFSKLFTLSLKFVV